MSCVFVAQYLNKYLCYCVVVYTVTEREFTPEHYPRPVELIRHPSFSCEKGGSFPPFSPIFGRLSDRLVHFGSYPFTG